MQITILLSGFLAAILFVLSGISFFTGWGNFKTIAVCFLAVAIIMFILMIIRRVREEWTIGNYKPKDQ
jgi:hypothetical protein